jgi:hypothetical protein
MTFDPDRPDAHKSAPVKPSPVVWVKVSDWGLKSYCERFRIGKIRQGDLITFELWDGRECVLVSQDPKIVKAYAQKIKAP